MVHEPPDGYVYVENTFLSLGDDEEEEESEEEQVGDEEEERNGLEHAEYMNDVSEDESSCGDECEECEEHEEQRDSEAERDVVIVDHQGEEVSAAVGRNGNRRNRNSVRSRRMRGRYNDPYSKFF